MDADSFKEIKATKAKFEGNSRWMYLDGPGHLTIGIGHLLAKKGAKRSDIADAIKAITPDGSKIISISNSTEASTDLLNRCPSKYERAINPDKLNSTLEGLQAAQTTPRAADAQFIPGVWGIDIPLTAGATMIDAMAAEGMKVLEQKSGQRKAVEAFSCASSFMIDETTIDDLLKKDIKKARSELKGKKWIRGATRSKDYQVPAYPAFADLDSFHTAAQMAIVDLAFQFGANGINAFKSFVAAVERKDWTAAAQTVPETQDTQQDRTAWRKKQFELAAAAQSSATSPRVNVPSPGSIPLPGNLPKPGDGLQIPVPGQGLRPIP